MTGDEVTLQAPYVPLAPSRAALPDQPAIVALPVPSPYANALCLGRGHRQVAAGRGRRDGRLDRQSERLEGDRAHGDAPVAVAAKHVCLLFRRFVSWQTDVTRPYVEALEARGIPHVLVGGQAFHEREEIEAIRAALAAIEWPDDELSVFATLRGPFFAISDDDLLDWAYRFRRKTAKGFKRHAFHPYRVPDVFARDTPPDVEHLRPIADALQLLKRLHRHRNSVFAEQGDTREWGGASGVLHELLRATRAHVGFALRIGGEQALANVLHVAELARQYELGGGISFRGFVEELRTAAETAQAAEAPILEEDSDGVRMMTVHKAKGLEFPIVILVDLTCKLSRAEAGRWIDPAGQVCALKLGGWAPIDLLLHGGIEAGARSRRRRAARLRRRHPRPRRAGRPDDRRRGLRRRLARSADAGDLSVDGGSPQAGAGGGLSRVSVEGHRADAARRRSRATTTVAPGEFEFGGDRQPDVRFAGPRNADDTATANPGLPVSVLVGPARAGARRRARPSACAATT